MARYRVDESSEEGVDRGLSRNRMIWEDLLTDEDSQ